LRECRIDSVHYSDVRARFAHALVCITLDVGQPSAVGLEGEQARHCSPAQVINNRALDLLLWARAKARHERLVTGLAFGVVLVVLQSTLLMLPAMAIAVVVAERG
jgi:hypothetical protein